MLRPEVKAGPRTIGDGHPFFVIAEASSNHNRDMKTALGLIDAAAAASADAVKFQAFTADKIVARMREKHPYIEKMFPESGSMHEVYKQMELPAEWLGDLKAYSEEKGLIFLCTPFDEEAVDDLEKLDLAAYKIASYELWHLPLIRHAAATGKPLLISTGMANLADIEPALEAAEAGGCKEVALFHCAASYPAAFTELNLRAIPAMKRAFGVPVGYSDHSNGITAAVVTAALGGNMIEKHFTLGRDMPGPDHPFSIEPDELKALVQGVRECEEALGSPVKHRLPSEEGSFVMGRRSIFAATDIPAGALIREDMLAILRPGTGLEPRFLDRVVGRRAAVDIRSQDPLTWDKIA
ncbi:MAG: N-acetylneuraminate synthase family protein [Deltaproteobacteria bacterium]|nr:N-acetylneuraminate synthase family protein [Deltaproteobacteria bacterium]